MNSPPALPALSEAAIRECAYYLWLERGCPPRRDQEIWFAAEALLRDQTPPPPPPSPERHQRPGSSPPAPGDLHDRRRDIARSGATQRLRAHHLPRTRSRTLPRQAPNSPVRAGRPNHETEIL